MTIRITGASDDLIEIEGDIREEFNVYLEKHESVLLAFSDGTVLRVIYDKDGIWRISRVHCGSSGFSKSEGSADKDTNDIVTLVGDIKWVVLGDKIASKE